MWPTRLADHAPVNYFGHHWPDALALAWQKSSSPQGTFMSQGQWACCGTPLAAGTGLPLPIAIL